MSSFSSNAILAKARSMYSKRLTDYDYEELLKKRNVNEVVSYLKSETAYSDVLTDIKENNVHRGQLEGLLNKEVFIRLNRLMRFASKKELAFYRLGITELEIHFILTKIRLLNSNYYSGYEINIPSYLTKYASFPLYGLITANDYDSLLSLLKGTKYYDVVLEYLPKDGEPIDTNLLELEFKHISYTEYIDTVKKLFKGKTRKDLLTMLYTSIELQNITKIYRLKKFFNATPEQIERVLFLEHSRIPRTMMQDFIHASSAEVLLKMLADSPYKLYVDDSEYVFIEYYTEKIKYYLAKRYMRFSTSSALVYMTYKIVLQIEVDNLKHIIEGLRYGESPSQINAMLIY